MKNQFDYTILEAINNAVRYMRATPLILGGVASSGGGSGGPPGGFVGFLPQSRVTYDMLEASSSGLLPSGSLLDNLNHIRYRLTELEMGSGGGTTDHSALTHLAYADSGHTGFVPEAPVDGSSYARKDGDWTIVSGSLPGFTENRIPYADGSGNLTTNSSLRYYEEFDMTVFGSPPIPSPFTDVPNSFVIVSEGEYSPIVGIVGYSNSVTPALGFYRALGDSTTPLPVASGNALGRVFARPYDGEGWPKRWGEMRFVATEAHDPTHHGTKIEFYTTELNGSNAPALSFTICDNGNVNLEESFTYNVGDVPIDDRIEDAVVRSYML